MLALTKFGQSPILSLDFQLGGVKDTPVLPTGKENKKWKIIRRRDQHGVKRQVEKTAVPVPEDGWGRQAEAEFAQVSRYPGTAARAGWGAAARTHVVWYSCTRMVSSVKLGVK